MYIAHFSDLQPLRFRVVLYYAFGSFVGRRYVQCAFMEKGANEKKIGHKIEFLDMQKKCFRRRGRPRSEAGRRAGLAVPRNARHKGTDACSD